MTVSKKPARTVAPFSALAEVGTPALALAIAAAVISASGADLWAWSVQFQGGSQGWALAWWIMTVPSLVYFTACAAFAVADFTGMCAHRRVQPEAPAPTGRQYLKLLGHIGVTSVLVELPYMALVVFVVMPWRGLCGAAGLPLSSIVAAWRQAATTRSAAPLAAMLRLGQCGTAVPSGTTIAAQFFIAALLLEVMFYYSHRTLHHRSLYAAIHKLHHTFTAPCALASKYATHTEHVIGNLLPVTVPLLLVGAHPLVFSAWLCVVLLSTANNHSGYKLPGMPSATFHDLHHEKFNCCYGWYGLLDRVHETMSPPARKRRVD